MQKVDVLTKARDVLKLQMEGRGSLAYYDSWVGWIMLGIYLDIFIFFFWVMPNLAIKIINFGHDSNKHDGYKFWDWYSIDLSIGWILIISLLLLGILAYFYKKFMSILLKTSTIEQLTKKYADNEFIASTIKRWIKQKGFLNYTDKATIHRYAILDGQVKNLQNN